MAVDQDIPQVERLISLGGETIVLYNGRLPLVDLRTGRTVPADREGRTQSKGDVRPASPDSEAMSVYE